MNIPQTLAQELGIRLEQVEATLKLMEEGDSVPFIARYRKEITGSLDDVTLRNLSERLEYLKGLEDRRKSILESIQEQGKLTPELQASIEMATKLSDLENLYRPYKKKRKTRASIAKDAGLEPLAKELLAQAVSEEQFWNDAGKYLNPEKGIATKEDAVQGAKDILAEMMADVPHFYDDARAYIEKSGRLESKETKDDVEKKYASYAAFSCPVRQVKNYQTLALNRGENDKGLSVSFCLRSDDAHQCHRPKLSRPAFTLRRRNPSQVSEDSYKRLIAPTVENDIRSDLFLKAEDASIILFKDNLKQLALMTAPLKGKRVLGFDPAFVNGCKFATVDASGKLLHVDVIYPTISGHERPSKRAKRDSFAQLFAKRQNRLYRPRKWHRLAARAKPSSDETLKEAGSIDPRRDRERSRRFRL
jgi:uncharacterized protein